MRTYLNERLRADVSQWTNFGVHAGVLKAPRKTFGSRPQRNPGSNVANVNHCVTSYVQDESIVDIVADLVDIGVDAVNRKLQDGGRLAEPAAVCVLLEDVFEALPISQLEAMWSVVEARRNALYPFVHVVDSSQSKLSLLRLTSGLLRRLSRALDTVMCGKILLFLAFILPLSERSGVNVTGTFNADNASTYEGMQEDQVLLAAAAAWKPSAAPKSTPAAGVKPSAAASAQPAPSTPTSSLPAVYHVSTIASAVSAAYKAAESGSAAESSVFYRTFWRMQQYLYKPSLAVSSEESWNLFLGTMRTVLRAFEREDEEAGIATLISAVAAAPSVSSAAPSSVGARPGAQSSGVGGGSHVVPHDNEEGEEGEAGTAAAAAARPAAAVSSAKGGAAASSSKAASAASASATPIPSLSPATVSRLDREVDGGGGSNAGFNAAGAGAAGRNSSGGAVAAGGGASGAGSGGGAAHHPQQGSQADDDLFGTKFLTRPSLLSLELKDPSLRRHVILQFLIAMQYFLLPRKVDKDKANAIPKDTPPASVHAEKSLAQLRDLCYILLRRIGSDGSTFVKAFSGILAREVYWNSWKIAGASPFELPLGAAAAAVAEAAAAKAAAEAAAAASSSEAAAASSESADSIGSPSISMGGLAGLKRARASAGAGGGMGLKGGKKFKGSGASKQRPANWASAGIDRSLLALCADPARAVRPQLTAYVVPLRMALDYRNGIEPEYSPAADHVYVWRGLRLFASEHLASFFDIATGTTFANSVVKTLGITLPEKPKEPEPEPEAAAESAASEGGGDDVKVETPEASPADGGDSDMKPEREGAGADAPSSSSDADAAGEALTAGGSGGVVPDVVPAQPLDAQAASDSTPDDEAAAAAAAPGDGDDDVSMAAPEAVSDGNGAASAASEADVEVASALADESGPRAAADADAAVQ